MANEGADVLEYTLVIWLWCLAETAFSICMHLRTKFWRDITWREKFAEYTVSSCEATQLRKTVVEPIVLDQGDDARSMRDKLVELVPRQISRQIAIYRP